MGVDLAVWAGVIFVVLVIVLGKFAWGPATAALDRREAAIDEQLRQSAETLAEAQRVLDDYQSKLAGAADEVRELMSEAQRDAEHTKAEILAEARSAAAAEHTRTLREINHAKDAALKEIGEAAANCAVELSGQIVRREASAEDQVRLIRDAISRFPSKN